MSVLAWLIIGLVAGALARLLVPGRDPMGIVATVLLGLAGALAGGLVADALGDAEGVGLLGATLGAVALLVLWRALRDDRAAV